MAEEVKTPSTKGTIDIGGKHVKKSTAYLVGAAGVGVVIVAVMRKKSAAAAAAASSTTGAAMVTDPAGNQCAVLDAQTGFCPGTPEDISAQQQLSAGSDAGLEEGTAASQYTPPSLFGNSSGTTTSVPVFTDNGSWGQYVEEALGSNGEDATAAAIAKYLAGQSLTEAQITIVEQAIAIANYPPVSGTGGFPPSVNTGTTTPPVTTPPVPPPVTTPPANGKVTVPKVTGEHGEDARKQLQAVGFKTAQVPATTKAGKITTVTSQDPVAGKQVAKGSTVTTHVKIT
jgi:PASTA domain